ncbi:hypothetical protein JJL45_05150 [Tamlana sp. s12]|uniref:hypothetical protein n=1 Tax=Tamlana sp. s12 TaxID=1630406 RepID=UPI0007FED6B9|nr:hypothetical protein [Tamlana sp. s12]OBQ56109.1 hypothetical protein VQ01_06910 [Tamlana sp. s12]QQY83378.1 hypothetical protein JJL45_05150 [Tamlana sp. s12]
MKKLILKVWFYFFPKAIIKEVNEKLQDAVIKKSHDTGTLIRDIRQYLLEEYKVGGRSQYIPTKFKDRETIVKNVRLQFGERMQASGIILTNNLKLKAA